MSLYLWLSNNLLDEFIVQEVFYFFGVNIHFFMLLQITANYLNLQSVCKLPNICMQSFLSQQFLRQYSLLNSEDRQISAQANQYILEALKHPQILQHAVQMVLTKTNQVKVQMLGAHLIYIKIENGCSIMNLETFITLKQLIMARLFDPEYQKGAQNMLCSIMGVLVTILYPSNWSNLVQEMTEFMGSDTDRFNCGLTILQRAATELRNQTISRSLRVKAMRAFQKDCMQLLQVFQYIIQLNDKDINCKLLTTLEEWSSVNLPLLKSPIIIDFVLKQIMENSSIIRLGTLTIIKNALKNVTFLKKQIPDLSFNFQERFSTVDEMQSLNKITNYLIQEHIWFYSSLQLHQQDQDLENFIQIISTLLFSYSFLFFTSKGDEILQLPYFLFKSSFKKISTSTFSLWKSFYNLMQKQKKYAEQLHIDELASQMLEILIKRVALTKQQIKEEMSKNNQQHQTQTLLQGQMGFFQYRDQTTQVFKEIHDFFLAYGQNQEAGAQLFFNLTIKHLNKNFKQQKSIWIQLLLFIIQNCFGKGLDENNYQTTKALQILNEIFEFCGKQKNKVHEMALTRILTTIKYYRFQIIENTQLYFSALKFAMMYLKSQNIGHNAVLTFDKLVEISKQQITNDVTQEVIRQYLNPGFNSIEIKSKLLSTIIKLNTKTENKQMQIDFIGKIIGNIQNNVQTIHKFYQQEMIANSQPYLSIIKEIYILCKYQKQIRTNVQNYELVQKKLGELSVAVMNEAVEYCTNYPQSFHDYNDLVKCAEKFQYIVNLLPHAATFWSCHQSVLSLLNQVFKLFQMKNLNLLLEHGKLVILVAILLQTLQGKVSNKVDVWLKQNMLRINQFFSQYYEQNCNPDFKQTDPDIIRAYFTLEEAFCIYNYSLFEEQIPLKILQFSMLCLEKIIEKKLQKQVLSFILNYWQRKQPLRNGNEVGSWLTMNLIAISPIFDPSCHTILAKIIIEVFKNLIKESHTFIISQAMESPYFQFTNQKMKDLVTQYLPFFAQRQSLSSTRAIFSNLFELKHQERQGDEFAEASRLIYEKWRIKLQSNNENDEDRMTVYSHAYSD